MDKICLTTAIMVTLASTAMAENAHEFEIATGFNDEYSDGFFADIDGEFKIEETLAAGYGFSLSYEYDAETISNSAHDFSDEWTVEVLTPIGALLYGEIDGDGAAEEFYNDISGMDLDVADYDDDFESVRWSGDVGSLGYAISSRDLGNADTGEISIGVGYELNAISFGLGYDFASDAQDEAVGVSVEYEAEFSGADVALGVSYITIDDVHSIGIEATAEVSSGWEVEVYYAYNQAEIDEYGLELTYENKGLAAELKLDAGEGLTTEYAVEVEYDLGNSVGVDAIVYVGYNFEDDPDDDGYYVGASYAFNDNLSLAAGYSQFDGSGDLDFHEGASIFLVASF